jgi:hypothetical protein
MISAFQEYAFEDIIRIGIAMIVIVAGFLSIMYIIWWGFLMILSGGNEEKIKPAVNHIRHAVIGVIFLVAILFIFPVLMSLIGLPYGDYVKPSAIFETINSLSDTLFGSNIGSGPSVDQFDTSPTTLPSSFDNL